MQRHYVITAALLIQRQHVNDMNTLLERQSRRTTSTRQCNIKAPLERRSRRTTSTRQCNIKARLERQGISATLTRHAMLSRQFRFNVSRRTLDRQLR